MAWDDPTHSNDELAEALIQVSCVEATVRLEVVRLVARLAVRGVWHLDGQTTMANWVALHTGVSHRTARQITQVAQVINDLPALAAAFGQGRLCWDQLVALCQLATPETDAEWAYEGPGTSPEDLNAMVRSRQIRDRHVRDAIERRGLVFRPDGPGATAIRGCLPTDDAERVRAALDRIREQEAREDGEFHRSERVGGHDARCRTHPRPVESPAWQRSGTRRVVTSWRAGWQRSPRCRGW